MFYWILIFHNLTPQTLKPPYYRRDVEPSFDAEMVIKAFKSFKSFKEVGTDEIFLALLHNGSDLLTQELATMYNAYIAMSF